MARWTDYERGVHPDIGFRRRTEIRGGTFFRSWRQVQLTEVLEDFLLRQERILFGSSIEVRVSESWRPESLRRIRTLFAEVDVKIVVVP